ncbi:MAG: molybdopterin converting factor subunit 1 [Anaerolineae bacterium]|jgi:molybdopterin synthase catalytic subunit|nr:molybdopterin converting factor subunit 1 [Anaerolineae bacterium]
MSITILLFATLKDRIGQPRLTLPLDTPSTVAQVKQALAERYPHAAPHLAACLAAVNEEFAQPTTPLQSGDTLALFPPVSGGDGTPDQPEHYLLPTAPIDHDALIAAITTPAVGAVCLFSGMVRGQTTRDGHLPSTLQLEYEAYESMAIAKMKQVAREIRQRWPLVIGIAIAQRVGLLSVGQNTVLIACSSGHRDEGCFEAARYGIDRLKEIVPVWKREIGADGQAWVEGTYRPTDADHTID